MKDEEQKSRCQDLLETVQSSMGEYFDDNDITSIKDIANMVTSILVSMLGHAAVIIERETGKPVIDKVLNDIRDVYDDKKAAENYAGDTVN